MVEHRFNNMLSKMSRSILGDKFTYKLKYFHQRGKFPNLRHPKDISEKIISALFSKGFDKYANYADKVKVRNYIETKGFGKTLLTHYGVWDKPEEIDYNILPDKFILKANNGSGGHCICKNKSTFDKNATIIQLKKSLHAGTTNIERHYRAIVPKIFAEELIDTGSNAWPIDYKFTCINGQIMDIFVVHERETKAKYCTVDLDWNQLPYIKKEYLPKEIPVKPKHLAYMIDMVNVIAKDFPFVRIDLYEWNDCVYFSELTFSPWGGLMYGYTDEAIKYYGDVMGDVKM